MRASYAATQRSLEPEITSKLPPSFWRPEVVFFSSFLSLFGFFFELFFFKVKFINLSSKGNILLIIWFTSRHSTFHYVMGATGFPENKSFKKLRSWRKNDFVYSPLTSVCWAHSRSHCANRRTFMPHRSGPAEDLHEQWVFLPLVWLNVKLPLKTNTLPPSLFLPRIWTILPPPHFSTALFCIPLPTSSTPPPYNY